MESLANNWIALLGQGDSGRREDGLQHRSEAASVAMVKDAMPRSPNGAVDLQRPRHGGVPAAALQRSGEAKTPNGPGVDGVSVRVSGGRPDRFSRLRRIRGSGRKLFANLDFSKGSLPMSSKVAVSLMGGTLELEMPLLLTDFEVRLTTPLTHKVRIATRGFYMKGFKGLLPDGGGTGFRRHPVEAVCVEGTVLPNTALRTA